MNDELRLFDNHRLLGVKLWLFEFPLPMARKLLGHSHGKKTVLEILVIPDPAFLKSRFRRLNITATVAKSTFVDCFRHYARYACRWHGRSPISGWRNGAVACLKDPRCAVSILNTTNTDADEFEILDFGRCN